MLAVLHRNMLKSVHFSSALHYQPPAGYLLSYTTAGGLFLHLLLFPFFHQQRGILLKEKADHSRSLIRTQWYHYSLNLCPMFSILLHRLINAVATMLQHSPCSLPERAGEKVKWKKIAVLAANYLSQETLTPQRPWHTQNATILRRLR